MTTPDISLTVERVQTMDDREVHSVSESYLKGRLSRFVIDPDTQAALQQREMPRARRSMSLAETNDVFNAVKKKLYHVLYSPEVLPRHRLALDQMRRSVESQLASVEDPDADWRRSANQFLDMVKDELARVDVVLDQYREMSASHHLTILLQAVAEHEQAEDADVADDRLYDIARQVAREMEMWNADEQEWDAPDDLTPDDNLSISA